MALLGSSGSSLLVAVFLLAKSFFCCVVDLRIVGLVSVGLIVRFFGFVTP